jgi:hypothetical protein
MNQSKNSKNDWDFKKIASDFVKNLEPMPNDVKSKELAALIKFIKLTAEAELHQKISPQNKQELSAILADAEIARLDITFHNQILNRKSA